MEPATECVNWVGSKLPSGYGRLYKEGKQIYAHRQAYEDHYDTIPKGMCVCHKCDNPSCVNPEHLFLGSPSVNMKDCFSKGRGKIPKLVGEKNHKAKITEQDVRAIREDTRSRKDIAIHYGISQVMVSYIINRKSWAHVT